MDQIIIQGHRGCRGSLPENSIAGFIEAVRMGVDVIELDVVCTSDNRILVSHDPFMHHEICARPDGTAIAQDEEESYNIFRMSVNAAQSYLCGVRPHPRFPAQQTQIGHKPVLTEAVEAVREYCRANNIPEPVFNVEIKSRESWDGHFHPEPSLYTSIFLDEIKGLFPEDNLLVQSFDIRILTELRLRNPNLFLIFLTEDDLLSPARQIARLGFTPEGFSSAFRLVDKTMLTFCQTHRMQFSAWTVNDESEMKRLISLGVRNLITDFPERALRLRESLREQ